MYGFLGLFVLFSCRMDRCCDKKFNMVTENLELNGKIFEALLLKHIKQLLFNILHDQDLDIIISNYLLKDGVLVYKGFLGLLL